MSIAFGNTELTELTPKIAVVGVGGAGCNAVNNMIEAQLQGVDFVVANTDAQSLANSGADNRLQLGVQITQGLGAGAQPKVGAAAAEEAVEMIDDMLNGCHMAFITAGMGGGTGTGAAPIIARRAREKGILTVGVVTRPFQFEGGRRMKIADAGIAELSQHVDTLIIIPNQNLFRVADERTTFADAFNMADEVLHSGVRGITDLMVMPGLINLDFADVRTVMSEMGKAMMGTGEAEGDSRAQDAAAAAISNPLLEEASLKGAKGVIINVTGGMDMTLYEVDEAVNMVREQADEDALIVFGSAFSQDLEGKLRVSVVATGIEGGSLTIEIPQPTRTVAVDAGKMTPDSKPEETPETTVAEYTATEHTAAEHTPEENTAVTEVADAEDTAVSTEEPAAGGPLNDEEEPTQFFDVQADTDVDADEGAVASDEDELEALAVAAQGGETFVSGAPMMPKANASQAAAPADDAQVDSYVSTAEERAPVQEATEEPVPQKRSLFQVMTAGLRSNDATSAEQVKNQSASNDSGLAQEKTSEVAASEDQAPAVGGVSVDDRPAPNNGKDQLEIPSFLRRQQN